MAYNSMSCSNADSQLPFNKEGKKWAKIDVFLTLEMVRRYEELVSIDIAETHQKDSPVDG